MTILLFSSILGGAGLRDPPLSLSSTTTPHFCCLCFLSPSLSQCVQTVSQMRTQKQPKLGYPHTHTISTSIHHTGHPPHPAMPTTLGFPHRRWFAKCGFMPLSRASQVRSEIGSHMHGAKRGARQVQAPPDGQVAGVTNKETYKGGLAWGAARHHSTSSQILKFP